MKQLGLAVAQYTQDFDEKSPNGVNWYYPGGNGWAGQLYPYVKSVQVFQCPDDPTASKSHVSYAYNSNNTAPTGLTVDGYTIAQYNSPSKTVLLFEVTGNQNTASDAWSVALPADNPLSDAYVGPGYNGYSPAGWGAVGYGNSWDVNGSGAWNNPPMMLATGYPNGIAAIDQSRFTGPTGRHTQAANYLMADCHVKLIHAGAISMGTTNALDTDCGGGQDGNGYTMAAGTNCSNSKIAATFSLK